MFSAASLTRDGQPSGIKEVVSRYPLVAYFTIAYAGAWIALLPLLLAQNGLGVLPLRLPAYLFLLLATLAGPALSAVLVAWIAEGRRGVTALFARYRTRRAQYVWCLVALYGPLISLAAICFLEVGPGALDVLMSNPLVFFSSYSGAILAGLPLGPLGEELGWRGYALPRLQKAFGPLRASLLLGVLWWGWHLPLFFLPDWKGSANPLWIAIAFFSWVVPFTVAMTWVYNSAGGNTLVSTLMHAAENAAASLIGLHILIAPNDLFLQAKIYVPLAIALIAVTRGKLGITRFREAPVEPEQMSANTKRRWSARQIATVVVLAGAVLWVAVNLAYDMITGGH